jgi:hypothetical protein
MRLFEVTKLNDKELFEAVDRTNDTGFLTEDLVKIIKTDQVNEWSEPMDADELSKLMESWNG